MQEGRLGGRALGYVRDTATDKLLARDNERQLASKLIICVPIITGNLVNTFCARLKFRKTTGV